MTSELFESILKETGNDEIRGPYELDLRHDYEGGKASLKAIKQAIKDGAPINLVQYASGAYGSSSAFGEKEILDKYSYPGWRDHMIEPEPAFYVEVHSKDEGKYQLGNFIPNGKQLNPDFLSWVQSISRITDERGSWLVDWCNKNGIIAGGCCGKYKYVPRQLCMLKAAEAGVPKAVEWLEKHPQPPMFVGDEGAAEALPDERDITMFGIFNDGGNCFTYLNSGNSSGDASRNWYWSASEGETAKEFRARLNRAAKRKAESNYNYYVDGGPGSWGVKIFKNIEDFKKACEKIGLHPNLSEYE